MNNIIIMSYVVLNLTLLMSVHNVHNEQLLMTSYLLYMSYYCCYIFIPCIIIIYYIRIPERCNYTMQCMYVHICTIRIQWIEWNLSNPDTIGTD